MIRLRGRGLGAGMALGTAAVIRTRGGIPLVPEAPLRVQQLRAHGGLAETPEIILVAEDYRVARLLAGAVTWATVVGIVAEQVDGDAVLTNAPAVVDVFNLMSGVEDDVLVLVDAENGVVLVDPDGIDIAHYQAEHNRIAPRRRVYLDTAHLPAQTIDGRVIEVIGIVDSLDAISQALVEGADALYIPFDTAFLPASADEQTTDAGLDAVIQLTAGKPLILSDRFAYPLSSLLKAGNRAEIWLANPPRPDLDGFGISELRQGLTDEQTECFDREIPCSLPRLVTNLPEFDGEIATDSDEALVEALAGHGVSRLILSLEQSGGMLEDFLPRLVPLIAAANANLLPVFCRESAYNFLDETLETTVRCLVGAGVSGILTWNVSAVKRIIRDLNFSECQQETLGVLVEG